MSKDAKPMAKTNHTPLEKAIPQPLEKFIAAALMKLRNAWLHQNAMTGIQFYGEMED